MWIFIWQGKGYLVLLAIIADFLLTALIGSALGLQDATVQIYTVEFIIAVLLFIPIWFYGKKLNSQRRTLVDKATGKEVVLGNNNRAFWIPMQYWAIIYPVLLLLIFAFYR